MPIKQWFAASKDPQPQQAGPVDDWAYVYQDAFSACRAELARVQDLMAQADRLTFRLSSVAMAALIDGRLGVKDQDQAKKHALAALYQRFLIQISLQRTRRCHNQLTQELVIAERMVTTARGQLDRNPMGLGFLGRPGDAFAVQQLLVRIQDLQISLTAAAQELHDSVQEENLPKTIDDRHLARIHADLAEISAQIEWDQPTSGVLG